MGIAILMHAYRIKQVVGNRKRDEFFIHSLHFLILFPVASYLTRVSSFNANCLLELKS